MASEPIDIAAETLNPISKLITEFTQVLDTITNAEEKELYVQLLNKYPINDTAVSYYFIWWIVWVLNRNNLELG